MKRNEYAKIILKVLSLIRAIVANSRLYGFDHAQVEAQVGQLFKGLNVAFSIKPELTILAIEDDLIINNKAVRTAGQNNFRLFIKILQEKDIGYITFRKGMKKNELRDILLFLSKPLSVEEQPPVGQCIKVGKVGLKERRKRSRRKGPQPGEEGEGTSGTGPEKRASFRRQEIQNALDTLGSIATERLDVIREYYDKIERFGLSDTRDIENVISVFVKCFAQHMNPLAMLATQKEADDYTFTHVINVCILTLAQAASLGFTNERVFEIGVAASLHDVGKIFLSSDLLNKPGKLSAAERKEIEQHSEKGASYLVGLQNMSRLAFLGALEHHMRYDGTGYPKTNGKWKPHIVSQMIAISDTFDAMRSKRPYQNPQQLETIFSVLINGKGAAYNPMLVENFIRVIKAQAKFTGR